MIFRFVKYKYILLIWISGVMMPVTAVFGQFSPGELSRAHAHLEGSTNCTRCHEVGKEISGTKCLECHGPIRDAISRNHGFHAKTSGSKCTDCHKEHLGKNARTFIFDEGSFDHSQTGFPLDGRHAGIACMKCHVPAHISDTVVLALLREHPHRSFIGLSSACGTCHTTPHPPAFSTNCLSCHTVNGWQQVTNFDHSITRFPLEGRHLNLSCEKCHNLPPQPGTTSGARGTKAFSDCSPCHSSPHREGFSTRECRSCHSPAGWNLMPPKSLDHDRTGFPLRGKHREIRCDQCHRANQKSTFPERFRLAHDKCTDCHTDEHRNQFLKTYNNNCARCHTEQTYLPSTFTLRQHEQTKFPLTGAHAAVPCRNCHKRTENNGIVFHFTSTSCESCHRDVHGGKMKSGGCESCHSTESWTSARFDHSTTKFPLTGKHLQITCSKCHPGYPAIQPHSATCESCHSDRHAGQFSANGSTDCQPCHTTDAWRPARFNHQTQSSFPLTGKHAGLRCEQCHPPELRGTESFVRYKPRPSDCSSCHNRRKDG